MIRHTVQLLSWAVLVIFLSFPDVVNGKEGRASATEVTYSSGKFSWHPEKKLTWADFLGPVPAGASPHAAAATYCGIGFKTNAVNSVNPKLEVTVYNHFYTDKSWARPEDRTPAVLAHEQGHFDLCELYTRKLRERMNQAEVDIHSLKTVLGNIYQELQKEYRARQEAYERDTQHGLNETEQKKWEDQLAQALAETEHWAIQ